MFWIVRDWNQQLNEKVIMVSIEEFSTFSTCWCCWHCLMTASETPFVGDGSVSIWDITSTVKMIRLQLSCQQSVCFHISDELTQTLSGQFVQLHLITEVHDVSDGTQYKVLHILFIPIPFFKLAHTELFLWTRNLCGCQSPNLTLRTYLSSSHTYS